MAFYGVGLDVKVRELNLNFKLNIQQKGGVGLRTLKRIFQRMDYNGNKKLDASEFEQALAAFGLFPKKVELQALMKYYDIDGDGNISYEEFIRGLRDELTQRRKNMVQKAFNMLDRDMAVYDVSMNPEYIEGRKTRDQILTDFLNNFEGVKGNRDGTITKDEFFDYYTDLSMSVPSDEYFVRMMESTWQCPEVEDASSKAVLQMLLKEVRLRILELARNDPKLLRKVFNDFDLNQSGHLTIDEVTNMIAKLKISVERKMVYPFFKIIDNDNSGGVEFAEFERYVISNPY
ncbi:ef hand family protein [Stylonychia lemnae]|uniref:Ef hand family protein n=1 Tax=Stylonychia lemnae TaxID=5949 RepID=A0A078AVN7_STYLE|nr:ef hand family protein [Stylonychia lemnae]|eukprot:CDW86450.1 ef hand family protein [Stylonychia lemnae]